MDSDFLKSMKGNNAGENRAGKLTFVSFKSGQVRLVILGMSVKQRVHLAQWKPRVVCTGKACAACKDEAPKDCQYYPAFNLDTNAHEVLCVVEGTSLHDGLIRVVEEHGSPIGEYWIVINKVGKRYPVAYGGPSEMVPVSEKRLADLEEALKQKV